MAVPRSTFDQQLGLLRERIVQLSDMVDQAIADSVTALYDHNLALARQVDQGDAKINSLRYEIEEEAYKLIALQQPNSGDMRLLMAGVSITINLERMGDHAAGIARLTERVGDKSVAVPVEFHQMADTARKMLHDAMTAFKTHDQALVRAVMATDHTVDDLHRQVYDELIKQMIADPSLVEPCTLMLWVSHNLERIADRVTNICERVIYLATGELTEYIDTMP